MEAVTAAAVLMLALCGQMVTIEAEGVCQLPEEPGLCKGYFPKFFHNSETGTCEQFIYGGCGGNGNKFDTLEECQATCANEDVCQLPQQPGLCRGYSLMFFYNSETGTCEQFIYGGCGGNGNKFGTKEKCQAACAKKNVCQLPEETGLCRAYSLMFFYNSKTGTCEQFIYGGCGGNGNKFGTKEKCQAACAKKNVCQLPEETGLCRAYSLMFFYNSKTGTCEQFVYGGCGGNGNKFDTKEKCQAACA